jgi:hypothetical protein
LVESIRRDFTVPSGFEPRAVREARARQEQGARRAAEEERRKQDEEQAREQAEQEAADRHWAALTPEEQARFDSEALKAFPLDAHLLNSPLRRIFLRSVRAQYLGQLLRTRETSHVRLVGDAD